MNLQGGSTNLQGSTSAGTRLQPTVSGSTLQPAATAQQLQPTVNPYNVYSGGSGGGGSGTLGVTAAPAAPPPPPPDPYAQWGGRAGYDRLVTGFNTQKSGIHSSAADAATNSGLGLRNSILDFIDSLRAGQGAIDNRGINNELAKQRGTSDVYNSVSNGIRSGGVTLANRNASDSSATDRIAEAYSKIGQRQLSDIGNQYEIENQEIGMAQGDLERQRASGLRRIDTSREQAVNSIVADANDKLAALDAAMANASLPERISIDAEKNSIRGRVLGVLDQYDNELGQANDVRAMALEGRVSEATRRGQLGSSPEARFNFTSQMPSALQGTGPMASELPIFTYRRDEL